MKPARPIRWVRLFTAFGTAAVVAALLAGMLTLSPMLMAFVLLAILAFEMLLVLPVYLLLHWSGRVTHTAALACGFIFGASPWAWFAWPLRYPQLKTTSSSNGVETMVDGVPTLAGWTQYGSVLLLFGMFGVIAAHGFWVALGKRRAETVESTAPISSQAPTVSAASGPRGIPWRTVVVIIAIGGILALPAITKDRSCHNVFRDVPLYSLAAGGQSARPKVTLYVPAQVKDWNELARFLRAFGKEAHLDVLDLTKQDEHSKQLYVSLCNEGGTVISVLESVYFFGPPREPPTELMISVFGMRAQSDWRQQASALEAALRATHGDKVRGEDRAESSAPFPIERP